jgi:hypothetical protein
MQAVSHLVKESLPNYLKDLPIPDSVLGKNLCCGSCNRYGIRCLFLPRNPGWVKKSRFGSGSGMNKSDHISESLETIFLVKNS